MQIKKYKKFKNLLKLENDADIAKYIPGTLELVYQGILKDIDTKEQPAHISYKDMENLEFQILVTNNYYTNPNSMHIGKLKRLLTRVDIDPDLITVSNFFAYLIKEISVTKYGNDMQLILTFSSDEVYQIQC